MALVSAEGLPIALDLYEATPHEATLAFDLVEGCWTVERFFSWMQNFRHLCLRWERKSMNFFGFVLLSTIIMHIKYQF